VIGLVDSTRGSRLRPVPAALSLAHARGVSVFAAAAALVVGVSSDAGGYYPSSWASTSLLLLAAAALALALGGLPLARRDGLALATLAGWLAVVAAGTLRSGGATAGVPELERGSLYLVVLWTALIALRPRTIEWCLAGLLAGIGAVTIEGLVGVLLRPASPDYFEGRLLSRPVGYANGMGMLAVFGIVLALAFVAHGRARVRVLAAALLVPLAAALALTGSRGALVALVAGLVVFASLDGAASPLVVMVALPAVAGAIATASNVTDAAASSGVVARDGRLVAVSIVSCALANAALAARLPGWRRQLPGRAAGAIAVVACALVPFGLHDRVPFWRAAWIDYATHPLLGSGPGTFAAAWLRYRTVSDSALDAHNLYLQTLAELGPLGLALLVLALLVPLSGVRRARHRFAPAAAAAYAAYLTHAAVDWDWQLPAVTLVAVVLGAVLIVGGRPERERSRLAVPAACTATALVALAACAMLVGSRSLVAASHAARAKQWPEARALAARAARWQPWSAEPLLVLGQAQAATGDRDAAIASFRRATALAPNDWRPWYDLALASHGTTRANALTHVDALVR
jgi:O-antigen ligase